ncbi:MAG: DNRLRE domain-containing protein [Mangrovibacterium sp.]
MKTPVLFFICILSLGIFCGGCDYLVTDYKLDTNANYLESKMLIEYIDQGNDTTLTLYRDAIMYAGMEDLVTRGNQTRIVPTNKAIRTILLTAGVSRIEELSPNVVKGLFSYLIIPGMYRSVDLDAGQTIREVSLSGDSLYLTRRISGTDRYQMSVNDVARLETVPVSVIRQDYVFSDGIAHVVDLFPVYQEKVTPTAPIPDGVDYSTARKDTLWITEDSNVYLGAKTTNYDGKINQIVARTTVLRYTFFKFDLNTIDYVDDLASAKLHFFVPKITGSNYIPVCGIYETSLDWNEKTLNWNNMPAFGMEVSVFNLAPDWNATMITQYIINSYKSEKSQVSFGLQALNGADITSSAVQIQNSEASNGIYKPFISLMSAIPSELHLDGTSPVRVENNGIARLTKDHISMSGPSSLYHYSDNNIIYVLMNVPSSGTLTKYGLPMVKYAQFTQEELASGAVKYVHDGNGTGDSFVLKVQDYIGGVYPEFITLNVQVQ